MKNHDIIPAALLLALLIVSTFIFWPALSGPFLLDDFVHLPKLAAANGSIDTLREIFEFTLTLPSATGRPLSLLSILINDNSWPTDPWSFKYTNLLIHLINGVLVFVVCRQIATIFRKPITDLDRRKINLAALAAMAIWLLHPIQISAMMLVIQRMTLLMATFTLLGIITYIKGRMIAEENPMKGYLIMSGGVGLFGILGALCKEPAIMMVSYIIAINLTIMAHANTPKPPYWNTWKTIFLILPLAGIVIYFFRDITYMNQLFEKRNYDLTERLLTESRVLVDYLKVILLPSLSGTGPYHDDYVVSRSLFNPLSTLASIIFIIAAIISAIKFRKRFPLFSLAILWFFLGHLLESTFLPLELYFEHRNYLPMLGIIFFFSYQITYISGKLKKVTQAAFAVFLILISGISYSSSQTWGNKDLIANIWAEEHPHSIRAQLDAIRFWLENGNAIKAKEHMDMATNHFPTNAGVMLYAYTVDLCNTNNIFGVSLDTLTKLIPNASFEHASIETIRYLSGRLGTDKCHIPPKTLVSIIDLYLENEKFYNISQTRALLYLYRSQANQQLENLNDTINDLDQAYQAVPRYTFALNIAYLLSTAGLYDDAFKYINIAKNTKPFTPYTKIWQDNHIEEIENALILQQKNEKQDMHESNQNRGIE